MKGSKSGRKPTLCGAFLLSSLIFIEEGWFIYELRVLQIEAQENVEPLMFSENRLSVFAAMASWVRPASPHSTASTTKIRPSDDQS